MKKSLSEKGNAMLVEWQRTSGKDATMEALLKALSSANEFYSKILFTVHSRLNIRILKAYLEYKFTPAVQRVNEASFFEVKTS